MKIKHIIIWCMLICVLIAPITFAESDFDSESWHSPEDQVLLDGFIIDLGGQLIEYAEGSLDSAPSSITIPDIVNAIGKDTFANSTVVRNITLPDSVTYIEEGAFNNPSIAAVLLPLRGVMYIAESAFPIGTDLTIYCTQYSSAHSYAQMRGIRYAFMVDGKAQRIAPTSTPIPTPPPLVEEWDIITFGTYEQDNDTGNGAEPLEWIVLKAEGDRALVITKNVIDVKLYNDIYEYVKWGTSTLRKWLNKEFINAAFSENEQDAIIEAMNVTPDNPTYDSQGSKETRDMVFCLSIQEAEELFKGNYARLARPTAYAIEQGAQTGEKFGAATWWLRSPGYDNGYAATVVFDGNVSYVGEWVVRDWVAVRPALWIDLTTDMFQSEYD